jgi:hypothetical protein
MALLSFRVSCRLSGTPERISLLGDEILRFYSGIFSGTATCYGPGLGLPTEIKPWTQFSGRWIEFFQFRSD